MKPVTDRKQHQISTKASTGRSRYKPFDVNVLFKDVMQHCLDGRHIEAEFICQKILTVNPRHAESLHILGLIFQQRGHIDQAIDLFYKAIEINRSSVPYYADLAAAFENVGRFDKAASVYHTVIELSPEFAEAHNSLGNALANLHRFDEAVTAYNNSIVYNPYYAEAYSNLGNTLKALGRSDEAVEAHCAAVKLKPQLPEVHNNLGITLADLHRLEEAVIAYNAAIKIRPDYSAAYYNLASAFIGLGLLNDAVVACNAAIQFQPNCVEAFICLGNALAELGRIDESVAAYADALRLKPETSEAHNNLGLALRRLGLNDKAIAAHGASVCFMPENAHALTNLGVALMDSGRVDEALILYDRAAGLVSPGFEGPQVNKATFLMQVGQKKEALKVVDAALTINSRSIAAWRLRGEMKTFTENDPDIAMMESLMAAITSNGRQSPDEGPLHFALGKAWMDAGDATRAFVHFEEGNRLARSTFSYDAETNTHLLNQIALLFTPKVLDSLAGAGNPSDLPIFVVGMPRSGTTLVKQILASHPEVHGAGELPFLKQILLSSNNNTFINIFEKLPMLHPEDFYRFGGDYISRVTALSTKRRIVDKLPGNFIFGGMIRLILPNARIIHIRRNAIDTCLSCYTKWFGGDVNFAYNQRELGLYYKSYERLTEHWRNILPDDRFIEVSYEDIVDDLENQARRLVNFCGLNWDSGCLEFHKSSRQVRTASAVQVRQPIYRASIGRWKHYARYLGPLLEALGIEFFPD